MLSVGRLLIVIGVALVVLGLIVSYSNFFSWLRLGRLPGDILVKRGNFQFCFPIVTCILISLILTLILYLMMKK
jgi:hypothetical protein